MSSVIFSSKRDALTDSKYRWVPDAISESNVRVSVLFQIPDWKGFLGLDKYLFPDAIKSRNRFIGFIQTVLGDRLALGKQQTCRDIFAAIANAKDENNEGFGMHQLGAEAATLIVAGMVARIPFLPAPNC
jgi:cytochrome P450